MAPGELKSLEYGFSVESGKEAVKLKERTVATNEYNTIFSGLVKPGLIRLSPATYSLLRESSLGILTITAPF